MTGFVWVSEEKVQLRQSSSGGLGPAPLSLRPMLLSPCLPLTCAMNVAATDDVYESLDGYNWDDDAEFQSGLSAILGNNSSPEQASELTLRARCFYYARFVSESPPNPRPCPFVLIFYRKYNVNVDFDAYKAHRHAHGRHALVSRPATVAVAASTTPDTAGILPDAAAPANPANEPPAPYPTSFAHIVELVTTGQPIPGIKEIPSTILTGQASQTTRSQRRKPWEKDESVSNERPAEETAVST